MGGRGLGVCGALVAVAMLAVAGACSETPLLTFEPEDASTGTDAPAGGDSPASPDAPGFSDGGADVANDTSPAADSGADAPADAPTDAPFDAGTLCDAGYFCPTSGTCVGNCKSSCGGNNGLPIECIGCTGSVVVVRRCVAGNNGNGCLGGAAVRCPAPNNVNQCPGPRQVRLSNECYACGENGTSGQDCAGGNQCVTNGSNMYECN